MDINNIKLISQRKKHARHINQYHEVHLQKQSMIKKQYSELTDHATEIT